MKLHFSNLTECMNSSLLITNPVANIFQGLQLCFYQEKLAISESTTFFGTPFNN